MNVTRLVQVLVVLLVVLLAWGAVNPVTPFDGVLHARSALVHALKP